MRKGWLSSLVLVASLSFALPALAQDEDFGKSAVARTWMAKSSAVESVPTKTVTIPKTAASPYAYHEEIPKDVDSLMERVEIQNGAIVNEYEKLLEKDAQNPDAPKWLAQIAEFHWQTAHYAYLRARRDWLSKLDGCVDDETKCPQEPVPDYSQSIADYRRIITTFPSYERMDDVLFRLGDALIRNGQPKEGISYLHRLTQSYPNYKDLDAAYLAMGEFYFSQKNTGTAQAAYQTIIEKYPQSTYFQYAQYKYAWTFLNLGEEEDYRRAIDLFKKVVESIDTQYASAIDADGQVDENKLKVGEVSFRNQALNDLSTTYAELPNGWKEARDYLQTKLPPDKARDKVEQLGGILDAQGKFEEEIELYGDLIVQNPKHPHLFDWYTSQIEAYKQSNRLDEADKAMRQAIMVVLPDTDWYRENEKTEPNTIKRARQFCAQQIYTIAVNDITSIEKAPENQKDSLWKDAEDMLRLEMKYFSDGPSSFDIHYSYAYVLDERSDASLAKLKKQYGKKLQFDPSLASDVLPGLKEAAQAYQTIIEWPNPGENEADQIRVAANRQVFVYANILATSDPEWSIINSAKATNFVEEKRGSEIHQKEPLSEAEEGFVHSVEQFASRYPKDDETPAFLWRAAEIYRSHYDYDQAAQRFDGIVSNFPDHQYAAVSVGSMFELYNKAKNYEKIEYWAKWLIDNQNFKHYTKSELEDTASFAIDRQAVALAENKQYDEAISTILRIEESYPERREHSTAARLRAASFAEDQQYYMKAVELLKPLRDDAATKYQSALATYRTALNYSRLARFEQAAENFEAASGKYFELMADLLPKPEMKQDTNKSKKTTKMQPDAQKSDSNAIKYEVLLECTQAVFYGTQLLRNTSHEDRALLLLDKYISNNTNNNLDLYKVNDELKVLSTNDDKSQAVLLLNTTTALLELTSIEAKHSPDGAIKRLSDYVKSVSFSGEHDTLKRQVILQWAQIAVDHARHDDAVRALATLKPDEATWTKYEMARHAYLDGRRAQLEFEEVVLEFPIRTLRKRIEEKAKKRQAAEKLYQQAISYKSGSVSTAAAFSLAQMALHFRDAFRNLPAPKELENDPAGLEEYNIWVEDELIFPAEDAAASLLDFARQITLQLESYTSFAHDSAQTLAELKPDEYPVSKGSL